MAPQPDPQQPDDIQQAIHQASASPGDAAHSHIVEVSPGDVLTQPTAGMSFSFALTQLGVQVQRYPWQTLAAMVITIGCGWVCVYFGLTVLAGFIFMAIYTCASDNTNM